MNRPALKVFSIIFGLMIAGLLGAAIMNSELWGQFTTAVCGTVIFWFGYGMAVWDEWEE